MGRSEIPGKAPWLSRVPRAVLTLCALVFAFGGLLDTRQGSTLEKAIADASAAITCAIIALALEPEK